MKRAAPAIAALCAAALASGCITVVAYDNYWTHTGTRTRVAVEGLGAELAVGAAGGLAYSLDDDVSVGDGLLDGVGAALLLDLQAALVVMIASFFHHPGHAGD
ncbi:MAG TPA: hypothetical protein VHE35_20095 [Kofleriaceae bacterium]|nr:hypothetical protein [Kofleriaceae bacterium]